VALRPGGYHIMLMGLNGALKEGDTVPLTLRFENADGKTETQEVRATVRSMSPAQHQH
jgi:copper(I)-binding protein